MDYDPQYLANLNIELTRCCCPQTPGIYNTYKDNNGVEFQGCGESTVKKHLTSSFDYVKGRQFRFPGIANGWNFSSAIEAAGFEIAYGRNYRNQMCTVIRKRVKRG